MGEGDRPAGIGRGKIDRVATAIRETVDRDRRSRQFGMARRAGELVDARHQEPGISSKPAIGGQRRAIGEVHADQSESVPGRHRLKCRIAGSIGIRTEIAAITGGDDQDPAQLGDPLWVPRPEVQLVGARDVAEVGPRERHRLVGSHHCRRQERAGQQQDNQQTAEVGHDSSHGTGIRNRIENAERAANTCEMINF